MVKLAVFCVIAALFVVTSALSPDCPVSNQMTSCSPKCKDDTECHGLKCCPNICNTKSCAPANKVGQTSGINKPAKGATGQYCGNVKCNSYEKCDLDRNTNRPKCVRQ